MQSGSIGWLAFELAGRICIYAGSGDRPTLHHKGTGIVAENALDLPFKLGIKTIHSSLRFLDYSPSTRKHRTPCHNVRLVEPCGYILDSRDHGPHVNIRYEKRPRAECLYKIFFTCRIATYIYLHPSKAFIYKQWSFHESHFWILQQTNYINHSQ